MEKSLKLWVKQEKRLIKLLYKKGLIKKYNINLNDLYWESYKYIKKCKYYLPELHYATYDYWGECNEHAVVEMINQCIYWDNIIEDSVYDDSYPKSSFKAIKRKDFINYLTNLPTIINDSAINKFLKNVQY